MQKEKIDFRNPAILITFSRMISSSISCLFLFTGIFPTATFMMKIWESISDFLDGFVARYFNCKSHWGRILDPPADKMSNGSSIVFITMGAMGFLDYLETSFPPINQGGLSILFGIEIVLFVFGFIFVRYGFEIKPNYAGKCKMFSECVFLNLYFLAYLKPWGFQSSDWIIRIIDTILFVSLGLAISSLIWHAVDIVWPARKVSCA